MEGFENLSKFLIVISMLIFVIVIIIYILIAIFLNKFHKLVNGKGTTMAFIPIANIYLLGKLTVNKIVGYLLILGVFLKGTCSSTINGEEKVYTILPENIKGTFISIYNILIFGLLIYAIIKYKKLKQEKQENN